MEATKLVECIEKVANPILQASWDQSGMQVAAHRKEVQFVGVFLDPVPRMLEKAIASGADFLLSHHPLTLKPRLPERLDAWHESLRLLLAGDVYLYAAHTSLDVNLRGPAGWLGRALNLANWQPLEQIGSQDEKIGYGMVGELPCAVDFSGLIKKVLRLLGLECAHLIGGQPVDVVEKIAYCGGSGADLAEQAKLNNCQLYITGDVKHHAAIAAELPVLDVGHHSIEEEMMRVFASDLQKALPSLQVEFFQSESPFQFVCHE